jgi:voltage-gated potassium channel
MHTANGNKKRTILETFLRWPERAVRRFLPRRTRRMLLVPAAIVLVGTVAYPLIEGEKWGLFDGLYMTVITLTTLGYGEIPEPLSKPGRVFTMVLALGGIFTLFYFASDIVRSIVTGELHDLLGKERMDDQLKHLEGHTIVCGFGRMGKIVCDELERLKQSFVVIDTATAIGEWKYRKGLRLQADATEDEFLRKAGIERARALIAVVGSDAANLYITLSARLLNPKILIVARAEEEEAEAKLRKVGASKVISPYLAGAHRAVQTVFKPSVQQFIEVASRSETFDLHMEELKVEAGSPLVGQPLHGTPISNEYGAIVAGMLNSKGDLLSGPTGDATIEPGAILILIGRRPQLAKAEALAKPLTG